MTLAFTAARKNSDVRMEYTVDHGSGDSFNGKVSCCNFPCWYSFVLFILHKGMCCLGGLLILLISLRVLSSSATLTMLSFWNTKSRPYSKSNSKSNSKSKSIKSSKSTKASKITKKSNGLGTFIGVLDGITSFSVFTSMSIMSFDLKNYYQI